MDFIDPSHHILTLFKITGTPCFLTSGITTAPHTKTLKADLSIYTIIRPWVYLHQCTQHARCVFCHTRAQSNISKKWSMRFWKKCSIYLRSKHRFLIFAWLRRSQVRKVDGRSYGLSHNHQRRWISVLRCCFETV